MFNIKIVSFQLSLHLSDSFMDPLNFPIESSHDERHDIAIYLNDADVFGQ